MPVIDLPNCSGFVPNGSRLEIQETRQGVRVMSFEQKINLTMLTDFYELTMANGLFQNGLQDCLF